MVSISSFAADVKVSQRVLAAFEKEFTSASNVSWEELNDGEIFHASFVYANEIMEAYYNAEGDLIAAARHISQERLPLLVSKTIRTNYKGFQFRQATEYMSAENTSYLITLDNEKQTLVVRIYNNGATETIKKTKKS